MKTAFRLFPTLVLTTLSALSVFAGHTNFDFSVDPTAAGNDPTGQPWFYFAGVHNHNDATASDYFWRPAGGNPGGYVSLTENLNNSSLAIVLPQLDFYTNASSVVTPSPIRNFRIDMDLRIGNPTNVDSAPADGISISFARPNDPALVNATNGLIYGWAGGANLAEAQAGPNPVGGAFNTPENGVRQGLSVILDAHQGNYLPDTAPSDGTSPFPLPGHSNDREGITARLDDRTLVQNNFGTANRNGACSNLFNPVATNACAISGFTCTNVNTLQTGPWGGSGNTVGSALLCWQHLTVTLTNNLLTVVWKGRTVVSTNVSSIWNGGTGRFILAGRTGGDNQVQNIDNLVIDTTPFTTSFLDPTIGNPFGFTLELEDFGDSIVTNITQVLLDGADVTTQVVLSNAPPETFGFYTQAAPLTSATHTVAVRWQTSLGEVLSATNQFTVAAYLAPPDSYLIPLSAIDTNQPGFVVHSYQSYQHGGNSARYAEEELIGLHGANIADQTSATNGGFFSWNAPLDFMTPGGAANAQGMFFGNNDFNNFGILGVQGSGNNGTTAEPDFALEFFAYVYFPTSGLYTFVVGGDDSHQLRFSRNPRDKFGQIAQTLDVNFMPISTVPPTAGSDEATFYITHAGCLPIRIMMANVAGDGALEVYTANANGTFSALNDTNDPSALLCYQASSINGPYVKSANPVWDAQNVTFYQPIVLQLGDGTDGAAINTNTIVLTSASSTSLGVQVTQLVAIAKSGDTTTIIQQKGTYPQWTNWPLQGTITNTVTFSDLNGTNYSYVWTFNVLGTAANFATNAVPIPASLRVDATLVDASQPGFRVKSWQSPHEPPNATGWTLEQLEGLHGPNVADQSGTNGSGYFVRNDLLDFRFGGNGTSGAAGEWGYDLGANVIPGGGFGQFGIGNVPFNNSIYAPSYRFAGANMMESAALDIQGWLVFTNAGPYLMQVNSDDGFIAGFPQGGPGGAFGLVGTPSDAGLFTGGRGVAGTPAGADTGGTLFSFNIPQPGAYPFRMAYYNGGTDGGLEVSLYQVLPDGSVAKVPLNDPSQPYSVQAFQTLQTGSQRPYLKYYNPVQAALDIVAWQPTVVDLADGDAPRTINTSSIVLREDGAVQSIAVTSPSPGTVHVVQQLGLLVSRSAGAHTNQLVFSDGNGASYTNTWAFTVMGGVGVAGVLPFATATLPASNAVSPTLVDHTQPGFRVKAYQLTTNTALTIQSAEEALAGVRGPNIANGLGTPPNGYFVYTNEVDLCDNIAINAASDEFRYNNSFSNYFGYVINLNGGGGTAPENYNQALFAGWMEFPRAGYYAMVVDSDDCFKVSSPFGKNPFAEPGTILGFIDGTRGGAGAAYPPNSNPRTHFAFYVPVAGAYPIRLLYYNGTSGINLEWSLYQYMPDGSVARVLINDTNTPGAVKVYQTLLSGDTPYVSFVPGFPSTVGNQVVNNWMSQTNGLVGNLQNPVTDLLFFLNDGISATVQTNTIQLLFNGVPQPINIFATNGAWGVVRPATALPPWPSGGFGPLTLTYQDSNGASYSETLEYLETPFWGTLTNAITAAVDTNKPGFKMRAYQLNPQPNGAGTIIPNRIHVAEQILAGLWGTNAVNQTAYTNSGYVNLTGTGPTAGVINLNILGAAQAGDFQSAGGFADQIFSGIPGNLTANANTNNDFACEILAYVEFPTNGAYTLGVASDDGFRLIRDWTPPTGIGTLTVNSPAGLAGRKPTVLNGSSGGNTPYISLPLTNTITGNLVLASGIGFGSTTNGEGCLISNPGQLTGNIAVMYRSASCGYAQQVANAQAAGAIAVVFIQNRPATEGPFPQEPAVTPYAAIPAVEIEQADGNAIVAALAGSAVVNATLTPMDYAVNPPPANPVLGQDDQGKGATDVQFPVFVQQAGIYPLRLTYWQGNGGGNCEFFTVTGPNRVLINNRTSTLGPGPGGSGLRAWYALAAPAVSVSLLNGNVVLTFNGILQSATDVNGPYADVVGATSPYTITPTQPQQFFRARMSN
jgi:hypothetical protein